MIYPRHRVARGSVGTKKTKALGEQVCQRPYHANDRGIGYAHNADVMVPEVGIEPTRTQGSLDFELLAPK